jgi:HAD superfamily hydrolase (TIGR01549 family)
MQIRAVIFDLDGTITEPYLDFDAIRKEMGLGENSGPVLEAMQKMSVSERQQAESILHRYEKLAVEESKLNPGARVTLDTLRSLSIPVGILTRNIRANAEAVAAKHGLEFDEIVGRHDGPVKPDAFGVLKICRSFGVEPRQTMVVGDYLYDLLCARTAGAIAVLLTGNNRSREFTDHADITIEKIDEILDIIKGFNGDEE